MCLKVSRAHKRASAIHNCFVSRVRAFKVYVRSLLKHNSVIWSPNTVKDNLMQSNVFRDDLL